MDTLITCEHLTKQVGTFTLKDINFELESGYILGVVGSNGSGKSTLVKCLLGSCKLQESQGDVSINKYSLKQNTHEYKEQIAYILNECPFAKQLTVKKTGQMYGCFYNTFDFEKYEQLCLQYELP